MPLRIILTDEAKQDLKAIRSYIHARAPRAAAQWLKDIKKEIRTLSRNPLRCPIAQEQRYFGYELRELLFGAGNRGTYRIVFLVEPEVAVVIINIRHASRLPAEFPQEPLEDDM